MTEDIQRGFFNYFSNLTARLEAIATFSNFLRDDFNHCDILSNPRETSPKASRLSLVTYDKTSTFRFRAKVDILSQPRKKKGGRPITVMKRPTFRGGTLVTWMYQIGDEVS